MVNLINKDTDLDKCGQHAIKDLGAFGLFDLARVSIHRVYFYFVYFISPNYNHHLFASNGQDESPSR